MKSVLGLLRTRRGNDRGDDLYSLWNKEESTPVSLLKVPCGLFLNFTWCLLSYSKFWKPSQEPAGRAPRTSQDMEPEGGSSVGSSKEETVQGSP
jgi:hypothetical protein